MPLNLFSRVEPTLGPDEEAYRLHFFATDRAQARASATLVLTLMAIVFALELRLAPMDRIGAITVVRSVFFTFSLVLFVSLRGLNTPAVLDRASLVWSIGFALQFVLVALFRPPTGVDTTALLVMILAMYGLASSPLASRTVAPAIVSVGSLLAFTYTRRDPDFSLWPSAVMVAIVNALGFVFSARLHTQRRRQFQSEMQLRASLKERDALIERLRQSHKMESMGRIVGGVAHDFNNILGTMLTTGSLLIDELPAGSAAHADAETMLGAVRRGAELTKQLLAFSRQQVLELKVVSLNELVADTQRMLMRTIGENISISVSLGDHLSAVRVDPGQVQQILLNLAVNARDAMPGGGVVSIRTRNVTLEVPTIMSHSMAEPGPYVVLTVTDDGTGMDERTMSKIFEPFFTTKPKGRGTGLGLATVFGIVEQSGGHVRVESAPGAGTTFEIFLPAVAERPVRRDTPHDAAELHVPGGSETILLAEDDPELRLMTARALGSLGYTVLQATDGIDALRVAQDHQGSLDLLTTDMIMPAMGGTALARELSARRPGLKVLFMSGYTDDAVGRGELKPDDPFLQKPVEPRALARKVRQVLDDRKVG